MPRSEAMDMTSIGIPLSLIENAIRNVYIALEEQSHISSAWTTITEDDLWRELVACILGSRVRFEVAHHALERLDKGNLLSESRRSSQFELYEQDVSRALSSLDGQGGKYCYPFYRSRASQIRQAAERFYAEQKTIRAFLENSHDNRHARCLLATEVSGLGPKQASLFLRNIGYTTHIAVLDVHVLTYMSWVGLTNTSIKSVSTIRKYEELEDIFIEHARGAVDRMDEHSSN